MEKYVLPGGSTRSEKAPAYHLVPGIGYRRTANRFALGAEKHGENNWKQSLSTEEAAYTFCVEAYNHMIEHAAKMVTGVDPGDDHLGAIGWAQEVLSYVEHLFGQPWTTLRRIV